MAKTVTISKKPRSNRILSMKDIAEHIKYYRTKLNLTRENAASMCSINYKTLEKIENGNEQREIGNVLHVAKMLGIQLKFDTNA
ncbi:MAG: hypothetical protein JXQ76_11335 [Campylobacterales bacterium]|nr:hypothetical protein [Campylobacterales bacterium]